MSTSIVITASSDVTSPVVIAEYGPLRIRLSPAAVSVRWAKDTEGKTHAVVYLRDVSVDPVLPETGQLAVPGEATPDLPSPIPPPW